MVALMEEKTADFIRPIVKHIVNLVKIRRQLVLYSINLLGGHILLVIPLNLLDESILKYVSIANLLHPISFPILR